MKKKAFETFILSYIETGGNINKVLNNTPENAGDKPKHKTWEKQHQSESHYHYTRSALLKF